MKKLLKPLLIIISIILLIILSYVAYVFFTYHRIEDNQRLNIKKAENNNQAMVAGSDKVYKIATYNVGFGAYLPDFSFFMDGGKYSRCYSEESSRDTITKAAEYMMENKPDFMLFQEVDTDATRSRHVNQDQLITKIFAPYSKTFAVNYDSAYLFYPFNEPIGKSKSGISTYSAYDINSAVRRSLPISTSFSKFLDLDRCYSINRVEVDAGTSVKELVIFNVHLSAYGNSDEIREGQLNMLFSDMAEEMNKGNYVICGGDFNHELTLPESTEDNHESWAYPFPRSKMPAGCTFAMDILTEGELAKLNPTCRDTGSPYNPEKSTVFWLDGFIISDNVEMVSYEVADTGFAYSDHQPVVMEFRLK